MRQQKIFLVQLVAFIWLTNLYFILILFLFGFKRLFMLMLILKGLSKAGPLHSHGAV